jgi:hypothetical protein
MGAGCGVRVTMWRRWVTGQGVRVGVHLVSRMPEDGRAVAEVKAGGLASVGVSESGAR